MVECSIDSVEFLNAEQHQLISFVAACNGQAYKPTVTEVDAWWRSPTPRPAKYRTERVEQPQFTRTSTELLQQIRDDPATISPLTTIMQKALASLNKTYDPAFTAALRASDTRQVLVEDAETPLDHLCRLGWLDRTESDEGARLAVSAIGRALLRDADQADSDAPDVELATVQLDANDPLAYPQLVGMLASAGPGVLVDPYLGLEEFHDLVRQTQIKRFLISDSPRSKRKRVAIATLLGRSPELRDVDVRTSGEVHDRYVLTDAGPVMSLGTSVRGVGGRTTTMLLLLPEEVMPDLQTKYQSIWERGTPLALVDASGS